MNKKVLGIAVALIAVLIGGYFFFGNSGSDKTNEKETKITIEHRLGKTEITGVPETVVTFDYGVVDMLDGLGVEVAGLPKVSLPTYLDKYKDDKYAALGDLKEPNFEAIAKLKPELIIISGRQESLYDKFAAIAPTLFVEVDAADYFGSVTKNATYLGEIFEKEDAVKEKLTTLEGQFNDLKAIVTEEKRSASIALVSDGTVSVFGEKSRFGILYNEAGYTPVDEKIADAGHGQQVGFEYFVDKNPEYLFVVDKGVIVGETVAAKQVIENELMKSTDAFKNGRIVYLTPDVWYLASGGFTSTELMIKQLQEAK
ncbi:MAG: siderophore ABC transporter substrate-binding protein [Bacilli bacterium]